MYQNERRGLVKRGHKDGSRVAWWRYNGVEQPLFAVRVNAWRHTAGRASESADTARMAIPRRGDRGRQVVVVIEDPVAQVSGIALVRRASRALARCTSCPTGAWLPRNAARHRQRGRRRRRSLSRARPAGRYGARTARHRPGGVPCGRTGRAIRSWCRNSSRTRTRPPSPAGVRDERGTATSGWWVPAVFARKGQDGRAPGRTPLPGSARATAATRPAAAARPRSGHRDTAVISLHGRPRMARNVLQRTAGAMSEPGAGHGSARATSRLTRTAGAVRPAGGKQ